jgi:hypothetical protein
VGGLVRLDGGIRQRWLKAMMMMLSLLRRSQCMLKEEELHKRVEGKSAADEVFSTMGI